MTSTWTITIRTIILSVVLGGASGILAASLTTNYLSQYAAELGALTAPLRLTDVRPRALPETREAAVSAVREKAMPGVVEFHTRGGSAPPYAYDSASARLRGVLLTSDGWVLTIPSDHTDLSRMDAVVGQRVYAIDQVVLDAATGAAFVKLDADRFPVVAFGNGLSLALGDDVFAIQGRNTLAATAVYGVRWGSEPVRSSDVPARRYVLQATASETSIGMPIVNGSAELVGVMDGSEDGRVRLLPLEAVLPAFQSLLRQGNVVRPSLGVSFIDVSRSTGLGPALTREATVGALLYGLGAVAPRSAASEAGLREGDIILSVDGQPINGRTLDERVLEYRPGDAITLTVDREGKQIEILARLGSLAL